MMKSQGRALLLAFILLVSLYSFHRANSSDGLRSQRRLQAKQQQNKLHVLAIGSSWVRAEGVSYPMQMGENTWIMTEESPHYLDVCASSLFAQQSKFDVILIEAGLESLAPQLKVRFPSALIILIRLWFPADFRHVPSGLTFPQWLENNSNTSAAKDNKKRRLLLERTRPRDWMYQDRLEIQYQDQLSVLSSLTTMAHRVSGILWELPRPSWNDDSRMALHSSSLYFNPQGNALNQAGHEHVGQTLRSLVQAHSSSLPTATTKDEPNVGRESKINRCHIFDASTAKSKEDPKQQDKSIRILNVTNLGPPPSSARPNAKRGYMIVNEDLPATVTIQNPFLQPASLYVTYALPSSSCQATLVRGKVQAQPLSPSPSPSIVVLKGNDKQNMVSKRSVYLGVVRGDNVTLTLHSLQDNEKDSFRLLGIFMTLDGLRYPREFS